MTDEEAGELEERMKENIRKRERDKRNRRLAKQAGRAQLSMKTCPDCGEYLDNCDHDEG